MNPLQLNVFFIRLSSVFFLRERRRLWNGRRLLPDLQLADSRNDVVGSTTINQFGAERQRAAAAGQLIDYIIYIYIYIYIYIEMMSLMYL